MIEGKVNNEVDSKINPVIAYAIIIAVISFFLIIIGSYGNGSLESESNPKPEAQNSWVPLEGEWTNGSHSNSITFKHNGFWEQWPKQPWHGTYYRKGNTVYMNYMPQGQVKLKMAPRGAYFTLGNEMYYWGL